MPSGLLVFLWASRWAFLVSNSGLERLTGPLRVPLECLRGVIRVLWECLEVPLGPSRISSGCLFGRSALPASPWYGFLLYFDWFGTNSGYIYS